jgi:glycosyltransferase involved in cell wall biosynthesis
MTKNNIAVVYLARPVTGVTHIKEFAESYKKYASGSDHDLIVILKGLRKYGEEAHIRNLFSDINAKFVIIPDDGFDIHAYINITKSTDYEYYLFCNTYTIINTDNWLRKITQHLKEGVGLIGTSASYESLSDSWKVMQKINWLITVKHVRYDDAFAKKYSFYIQHLAPSWISVNGFNFKGLYRQFRRKVGDLIKKRPPYSAGLDEEFDEVWKQAKATEASFQFLKNFPSFPNPHIRSTGFLIAKSVIQRFNFNVKNSKEACALFESGLGSLTSKVIQSGLGVLVVNSDGIAFGIEDWEESQTFRPYGGGKNIFDDNHSKAWCLQNKESKGLLRELTWGPGDKGCADNSTSHKTTNNPKITISIVLPSHNRNNLVKDALSTILPQKTKDVEVIVFDNYSDVFLRDSLKEYLDVIRVVRSERFLSVTESWNSAIDLAGGDYIILLGDDDGLLPGAIKYISEVIEKNGYPDMVYAPVLQFFHPSVAPWKQDGYVTLVKNGIFFENGDFPRLLTQSERDDAVLGSLNFQRTFSFNMQAMIFKQNFLLKLRVEDKVFHTPFPDYYLANLAFHLADKLLVINDPFAIQGVSRPSFGYTLFNGLESKGEQLLNNPSIEKYEDITLQRNFLPGSAYNTSYLITMNYLRQQIKNDNIPQVNFKKYRNIQISLLSGKLKNYRKVIDNITNTNKNFKLTINEHLLILILTLNIKSNSFYKFQSKIKANIENVTKYNAKIQDVDDGNCATVIDLYNLILSKNGVL